MTNPNTTPAGGVGLFGWMFLIFLTLKLTNVITWSWLWVTAPLWGGLALIVTIFVAVLVFAGLAKLILVVVGARKPKVPAHRVADLHAKLSELAAPTHRGLRPV